MSNRVRCLVIDRALLANALGLPATTRITGSFTDPDVIDGPLLLKVEDDSFGIVEEGARIPRVRADFDQLSLPRFVRYT